jgi:oxaloacetate decarboxylase alpha subunit
LVSKLKQTVQLPIAMHCHATTGLSVATCQKAIDAGIDMLDGAVSTMSMTYGHTATETLIAMVEDTPRNTGIALSDMTEVATYFRDVRSKYAAFEGSLRGIDARILIAQVPGGMLTNMESQLKEQGAADRMDEVLTEIPKVRKDLGYLPLVTPTSQIVGTQAVLNVLTGERYKSLTKETAGVLKGEYGATAAPVNAELQARVLDGKEAITCRPADLIDAELDSLTAELSKLASEKGIKLAEAKIDDVLTYALFPQIGLKFLENRNNPDAFEKPPVAASEAPVAAAAAPAAKSDEPEVYSVQVDNQLFRVVVAPDGELTNIVPIDAAATPISAAAVSAGPAETVKAPLAGNIFKVMVNVGDTISAGQVVVIMEAMKMETEIRAVHGGKITALNIKEGDSVTVGQPLVSYS